MRRSRAAVRVPVPQANVVFTEGDRERGRLIVSGSRSALAPDVHDRAPDLGTQATIAQAALTYTE